MAYQVKILPGALQDAQSLFQWLSMDSSDNAIRWFQGLFEAIDALAYMPYRFPRAPESDAVGVDIHHYIYKRNYRILYVIEGEVVRIHHIRHSARQWMTSEEFELS